MLGSSFLGKVVYQYFSAIGNSAPYLGLAFRSSSRFRSRPMEFSKSAFPTAKTVLMFSHENASPASWAISFGSNNFAFAFQFVKLVH